VLIGFGEVFLLEDQVVGEGEEVVEVEVLAFDVFGGYEFGTILEVLAVVDQDEARLVWLGVGSASEGATGGEV